MIWIGIGIGFLWCFLVWIIVGICRVGSHADDMAEIAYRQHMRSHEEINAHGDQ